MNQWAGTTETLRAFVYSGKLAEVSDAELRAFVALLARAGAVDGVAWPGKTKLASDMGKSVMTAYRGVRGLADRGVIRIDESDGGNPNNTTRYKLLTPNTPDRGSTPTTSDTPIKRDTPTPITCDMQPLSPVIDEEHIENFFQHAINHDGQQSILQFKGSQMLCTN